MKDNLQDINVSHMTDLSSPLEIKKELSISKTEANFIIQSRQTINDILHKKNNKFLLIIGPCSIHDTDAALEYAKKVSELRKKVGSHIEVVMRCYFEKPRTKIGWKGLISDPYLDNTNKILDGIKIARKLLIDITKLEVPTATEVLDTITPQYIGGLISWSSIGARTSESQPHRQTASGLSMAVDSKIQRMAILKQLLMEW